MNIYELLTKEQLKVFKIKDFKKNTTIFLENEICELVGFVIEGKIKISTFTFQGNEIIYSIIERNQMFGNNLIFSKKPTYKGDVICLNDCKIGFINKTNLLKLFGENNAFLLEYLRYDADMLKDLNDKVKILSLDSAKERLLLFLANNNNQIEVSSITNLAKSICISRECLSRLISKLSQEKVLEYKNKKIILKDY